MNGNINLVKKKKNEEIDDDTDNEVGSTSVGLDSESKNKLIKLMVIIFVVFIGFLLILYVISLMTPKKYTYPEIEKILENAAVEYFKDYPTNLPTVDGNIISIDSSSLSQAEKMKDLGEYLPEGVACTGSVQVQKVSDDYVYTPYLNCGDAYSTIELYKKITNEANIVSSGYGLYAHNGTYTFRGEATNNYVKLDKSLWRIVKVTSNNNIVLIKDEGTSYTEVWDNRYNKTQLYDAGINNYSVSRIKEYLDKIYNGVDEKLDESEIILSKKDKAKLVPFNLCIGKRSANSTTNNNSEECSQLLKTQKIGLLTLSDFLYASLDKDCTVATSKTCKNYNYLTQKKDWWLITGDKDNDAKVFKVNRSGFAELNDASMSADVRPVIYLSGRALYKSGKGTLEKPYRVR